MQLKTRITDVRHNAETGSFEAQVTLMDATNRFTYSIDYPAPIDTDPDVIKSALSARARAQHAPDTCTLTCSRTTRSAPEQNLDIATHILNARPNYLAQILHR